MIAVYCIKEAEHVNTKCRQKSEVWCQIWLCIY